MLIKSLRRSLFTFPLLQGTTYHKIRSDCKPYKFTFEVFSLLELLDFLLLSIVFLNPLLVFRGKGLPRSKQKINAPRGVKGNGKENMKIAYKAHVKLVNVI